MKNIVKKCFLVLDGTVETIIAVAFVLMVIVGGTQVFNRYVIGQSLSWSEEFQKFMHIWIVFLAIPLGYKNGSHIGMKVVFDKLHKKAQFILTLFIDIMWFGLACVMVYYTTKIMKVAKSQTSPGLGLRMDLVYFCIVIGGVYLGLMALRKIVEHLLSIKSESQKKEN